MYSLRLLVLEARHYHTADVPSTEEGQSDVVTCLSVISPDQRLQHKDQPLQAVQEDATSLPMRIVASVATGQLIAFGFNIPLPIKGSGLVDLLYLDQDVRIFRSPQGSVTVQKRANAE